MTTVAIVFHSVTGTTRQLAGAVEVGALSVCGTNVECMEVTGADIVQGRFINHEFLKSIKNVDAVIFGSPTYMGSVSAQFKAFADATSDFWAEQRWRDKLAAGFTIGSSASGDQLSTIQYLHLFASQHGMLWTGVDIPGNSDAEHRNRLGAQSGLIAQSEDGKVVQADLLTARYLGERIANLAARFSL